MGKILVTYFSASGETKEKALELTKLLNADVIEIVPEKLYTSEDLNWRNKSSRSTLEMNDESSRPEIKDINIDLSNYETIFIGFPIWWGVEPRVIDTFIEKYNLTGKRIIPFATSGGSPISYCDSHLKKLYPSLDIRNGILLNFEVNKQTIENLLK